MTTIGAREPWSDERLEAAFETRASATRTPPDLAQVTVGRVRAAGRPEATWRRLLPAAAVVVMAIGLAAGGILLSNEDRGSGPFRAGPTADLRTFDNGEFAFDFPASWLGYEAVSAGSGSASIAVLGTQPVEARCGTERHVEVNCVYEQRLEPGQVRVFVSTGGYRGQTVQDRAAIEDGSTTRVRVGGMPALLDEYDPRPDSFYREDRLVHWEVARPGTDGASVVRLEAMLREPGATGGRRQLDALVASFRFARDPDPTGSPTPEPTEATTAPRLADLRVMTVQELIEATVAPTADEVIVRGWLARSNAILDCNVELDPNPLIPHCEEFGLFLFQDPPFVEHGTLEPRLPHVVPMLRIDAHAAVPAMPGIAVEVLAMGHLLDHRWRTCPPDAQDECQRRFVIDRVILADQPLDDELPGPWASPSDRPVDDPSQAVDALTGIVGGITVISIGNADADAVRSIEPLVRAINNEQGAWVIRALVAGDNAPVARTFLVGDVGHPTISEMTESGVIDLMAPSVPVATDPPTEVLGLPVLSVEEAIAVRDAGRDDREIAVRGWYDRKLNRCAAPRVPVSNPLENYCQAIYLLSAASTARAEVPEITRVDIEIDDLETGWIRAGKDIELVAIGHFDDRRAAWCHSSRIDACRDRFVVDRVEWADGATQPLSVIKNRGTEDPPVEPVLAALDKARPGRPVLSVHAQRAWELVKVEPSLSDGRPGITDEPVLWSARVLEDGIAVTYIVVNGSDRIYRVEIDGTTTLVAGVPPNDHAQAWPPAGVIDVSLRNGSTDTVTKAGVVDRTGLVVEARAANDGDPRGPATDLRSGEMSIAQAAPDTIIAYWDGSLCDDRFVLTIFGERAGVPPDRAELRGEHASSCRLALIHRGIVVRFSRPVDAATIRGWNRVGTPFEAFPPVGAIVVALPNYGGGFTPSRSRAALIDLSGRITAVRLPRD